MEGVGNARFHHHELLYQQRTNMHQLDPLQSPSHNDLVSIGPEEEDLKAAE